MMVIGVSQEKKDAMRWAFLALGTVPHSSSLLEPVEEDKEMRTAAGFPESHLPSDQFEEWLINFKPICQTLHS